MLYVLHLHCIIHLIKIDNETNKPTDFQQKSRLSVGLLLAFPKGRRAKPSHNESHKPYWELLLSGKTFAKIIN